MLKNILKVLMALGLVCSLNVASEGPGYEIVETSHQKTHINPGNILSIEKLTWRNDERVQAYQGRLPDSTITCFCIDEGTADEAIHCLREFKDGSVEICDRWLFVVMREVMQRYNEKWAGNVWKMNEHPSYRP